MRFLFKKITSCFTRALVDLNALAWLEDYLQTWQGTLLVVYVEQPCHAISIPKLSVLRSHDRAFLWVYLQVTRYRGYNHPHPETP